MGETTNFRKVVPTELPQHIAATEDWKAWPRKLEAHVRWGVRERQVTSYCRTGRLVVWRCPDEDRKSTRLNSSHLGISYAVFCLKKKKKKKKKIRKKKNKQKQHMIHQYTRNVII